MQRIWVLVAMVGACASPPDTCDQHVMGDIEIVCSGLRATIESGSAAFSCEGGGSGTMQIGGMTQWSGSFTFDACAKSVNGGGDMLTLTGSVTMMGDDLNDSYAVTSDMLTIHGDVSTCAAPVDETCNASSPQPNYSSFEYDHLTGTMCGRHFP